MQRHILNTNVGRVYEFNFLVLTIKENLNWKSHIDEIANKISKCMGILNKLKHFLPLNAKVLIYYSLTLSHVNICITIWGYQTEYLNYKNLLLELLARASTHWEIFKTLKLLKVNYILKFQELKLYYQHKKKNYLVTCKIYLSKIILVPIFMQQEYNTKLIYSDLNMNVQKNCIIYDIPNLVNNTAHNIIEKNIHT